MKKLFLFTCLFVITLSYGQDQTIPERTTQKGFFLVDYLAVDMPTNDLGADEDHMGLTGIHYNLDLNGGFYGGLGMYGNRKRKTRRTFYFGCQLRFTSPISMISYFLILESTLVAEVVLVHPMVVEPSYYLM